VNRIHELYVAMFASSRELGELKSTTTAIMAETNNIALKQCMRSYQELSYNIDLYENVFGPTINRASAQHVFSAISGPIGRRSARSTVPHRK
jgi:hypothetical protein